MIEKIKKLLGIKSVDFAQLAKQGAVIIDVRNPSEYAGGHVKGSINIPLSQLPQHLAKLKDKTKPIITCCASGMRSASAKSFLKSSGYTEVYNGGGWLTLNRKIKP
ncbi:rhodanese-like domain-containing protein [Bergeyella sp. RCAD1439]|uniref:rhodanese-like domain-containing protein n=1 Tax=Bergeyella anatis TaxID=3113737 RepID=UPI002E17421E|nr:rhodanese-like domain-containing protein [Bergeyella sp. RCAD1439]